jgi:hypothetical protein
MAQYWFRRKRVGWGLEPGSREGWIATGVFIAIEIAGSIAAVRLGHRMNASLAAGWSIFWIAAFLAVIFGKAEPGWWKHWGDGT